MQRGLHIWGSGSTYWVWKRDDFIRSDESELEPDAVGDDWCYCTDQWAELIDFGCRAGGRWATRKAARHPSCRHWPPTPGAEGRPGEEEEEEEEEEDGEGEEEEKSRGGPAVQPPTPPALFIIGGEESRDQSEGRRRGGKRRPQRSQFAPRLVPAGPCRSLLTWPSFSDREHNQQVEPVVRDQGWKQWRRVRRIWRLLRNEEPAAAAWGGSNDTAVQPRWRSGTFAATLETLSLLHRLASSLSATTTCLPRGEKNGQRLLLLQY